MKAVISLHCPVVILFLLSVLPVLRAADDPAPPPGRPSREELREKFKGLTPEERQSKMRELREKGGLTGPLGEQMKKKQAELAKYRDSIKDLPPAEREAKLRQWRETNGPLRSVIQSMTPEEREAKRKELSERMDQHLKTLKARKADGSITEEESRRLERMEQMRKRIKSGGKAPFRGSDEPFRLPPPRPPGDKPAAPEKPTDAR